MNDEIELLIDEDGNKYHVLKNSNLDLTDKNIKKLLNGLKKLNNKYYYKNKLVHREDGPAVEYSDGTKIYYKNGELHREDGPAYISFGMKIYVLNGTSLSECEYNKYLIEKEYSQFKSEIKLKNNHKKIKI